jgi:EpsI family protein
MRELPSRLTWVIGALVVMAAGAYIAKTGYSFSVAVPNTRLSDFPKEWTSWKVTEEKLSEGVFEILDAHEVLNLDYSNEAGEHVAALIASWTNPDSVSETCPHHPTVCYGGNGWQVVRSEKLTVDVDGTGQVPLLLYEMQRGDARLVVGFCYRMGEHWFHDDTEARIIQLKLWGKNQWPAVVKFMVQTNDGSIAVAKPKIEAFARQFFSWYRG